MTHAGPVRLLAALGLPGVLICAGAACARDLGTFPAVGAAATQWRVALETPPEAGPAGPADPGLTPGRLLTLFARVEPAAASHGPPAPLTDPRFDAVMPAHGHGMFTKAKVTEIGPGRYRIDGVKLHMPGVWQLTLTLDAAGQPVTFQIPVKI